MKLAEIALAQVAQNNDVSVEEIHDAIESLIHGADSSFWNLITPTGNQPTPAELVQFIAEMLVFADDS